MAKLKTQAQLDRATDLRLRKIYGISLSEYNDMLDAQGNGCAICFRPPKTLRLNVDHDHASHKVKVQSAKHISKTFWVSVGTYNEVLHSATGRTKSEATQAVKKVIRRASCRALLCWHCNKGIEKFDDSPKRLRAAADYLERFQLTSTLGDHYVQNL